MLVLLFDFDTLEDLDYSIRGIIVLDNYQHIKPIASYIMVYPLTYYSKGSFLFFEWTDKLTGVAPQSLKNYDFITSSVLSSVSLTRWYKLYKLSEALDGIFDGVELKKRRGRLEALSRNNRDIKDEKTKRMKESFLVFDYNSLIYLLKEINGEKAVFSCINGIRMRLFSIDIEIYLYIFFYNSPFKPLLW